MSAPAAPAAANHPNPPPFTMNAAGLVSPARFIPSPNCDPRPPGVKIDALIVHAISLPPGEYGGDCIERLFTNRLDADEHPSFAEIAAMTVSAHFLIRRDGELCQFVPAYARAWHAGESSLAAAPASTTFRSAWNWKAATPARLKTRNTKPWRASRVFCWRRFAQSPRSAWSGIATSPRAARPTPAPL